MLDAIVIGATSALLVCTISWRWSSAGGAPRVRGSRPESADRVHHGPTDTGRGHPGRVRDPGHRVPGAVAVVAEPSGQTPLFCNSRVLPPPIERGVAFLPAIEHVTEFIAWASINEDGEAQRVRFRNTQMLANYRLWAQRLGVSPLPESIFFGMMAKHPQVKRSRERVKDQTSGRVVKLQTGTPVRETYYTISPPRPQRSVTRTATSPTTIAGKASREQASQFQSMKVAA